MSGKRLLHLGFDGMNLLLLRKFNAEGILPNFADLLERGSANRLLCTIPAWTPTNWASVLTGATTGTHGLGGWSVRAKADPWDAPRLRAEDSGAIGAETIWEVAGNAGLRCFAGFFPSSWPSRIPGGYVVAPGFRYPPFALAFPELYEIGADLAATTPAAAAGALDPTTTNLAETGSDAPLTTVATRPGEAGEQVADLTVAGHADWPALGTVIVKGAGVAAVVRATGAAGDGEPVAVAEGAWSDWLYANLPDEAGKSHQVAYRLRWMGADGHGVRILRSEAHRTNGFTDPPELAAELVERFGPFTGIFSTSPRPTDAELDACLDEYRDQGLWLARAARYVQEKHGWDLHFCHWHLFDTINHAHVNPLDPRGPEHDPDRVDWHLDAHRKAFVVADEVLGEYLKLADDDTWVFLNADHAMAPAHRWASIPALLEQKGLLSLKSGDGDIDFATSRSYLIPERGSEIFVNLKGREPQGSVAPEDYELVQEQIIDALQDWRDPNTGKKVVALALKLQDAQVIGIWGRDNGDVIFTFNRGFGWGTPRNQEAIGPAWEALHGSQIPTSEKGLLTNMGCLVTAGPDFKAGYERDWEETWLMRMIDIAPTIAHLFGLRPPAQSQGAVLWDLLEDDG